MLKYKVVSLPIHGRALEDALNKLAADGWEWSHRTVAGEEVFKMTVTDGEAPRKGRRRAGSE